MIEKVAALAGERQSEPQNAACTPSLTVCHSSIPELLLSDGNEGSFLRALPLSTVCTISLQSRTSSQLSTV